MSIESSKIAKWVKHGPTQLAINSHISVRKALSNLPVPGNPEIEVFLQGSYKNYTNIRGDGDVDIVVNLKDFFFHNIDESNSNHSGIVLRQYAWESFDTLVTNELIKKYGKSRVKVKSKAIEIEFNSNGYVSADVIISFSYRNYTSINKYYAGIAFKNRKSNELIFNYPKQHFKNGNNKSNSTNGLFRNYVRLLKNARNYIKDEMIPPSFNAPSYFIESLVYNLSDSVINQSPDRFLRSAIDIWEYNDQSGQLCQNGISPFFGYDDTCWNHHDKVQFSAALRNLLG